MAIFLGIIGFIFVIGLIAAPIIFMQTRKTFREQKNFERGLKIVPLFIHLPPVSDDIEVGGRDARDVTEETISKAQIIYNIIASTLQKGFKSNFYGQRHFAFEIIGSQGFVYFYAAVPIALLEVVKQAVVSAYPTARLEERPEHNIFSQVGKLNGTLGGELNLKESFAYPIATYQDLKQDSMQALLNAMGTLDKEDGAAIQILMRPANPNWRKKASSTASDKRSGKKHRKGGAALAWWVSSFVTALFKPPEDHKEDESKHQSELSSLEQATLDAIDDKTRHAGFEVLIRVVVSSNVSQRAQAILSNIVASFAIYNAPGKNGFSYTPAKDVDSLVTAYVMRFFPQQQTKNVLNSVELATIFHFPDQRSIPTSQLSRQESKQVDGPRNIPDDGLLLGYNVFRGAKKPIRLALSDRQRHMYAVGQTGTGKSTFLENLALQDMLLGNGFAFVDPHGDTAEKLLSMVPKERTEDVIYFCPSDMDYPMGLNLFEYKNPDQKDFLIQEALNMLYKLYDPQHSGIMGPRYEHLFRNAALTIMADPEGGTFIDLPKLFQDKKYVQQKLQHVKDMNVLEFWNKEMPASERSNDFGEVTSWFVSKFGAFRSNEMMRNIIGQTKSAFDLRDIMDNKKILLVNLSKGRTGELNSKLLGMMFVMKFQAAAMSRSDTPEDDRVDFSLYVDEFQNFSTDSFATIMSEARKYHLNLIVANQFTTQLTEEIRDAVFGNIGTIVSFRIGQNDVDSLSRYFQPSFDGDDLVRIPNANTVVRTLIGGVPTQPFSMATLPPLGNPNPRLADALKQLTAAKYGRPRAIVEAEINERMATKGEVQPGAAPTAAAPAASPWSTPVPANPALGSAAPAPAAQPTGSGSFLDEWLNKRKTGTPPPSHLPQNPAAVQAPTLRPATTPSQLQPAAFQPNTTQPAAVIQPASPSITKHAGSTMQAPAEQPVNDGSVNIPLDKTESVTTPTNSPSATPNQLATPAEHSTTHNISSDSIEKHEIDQIAAQLRQRLDNSKAATNEPKPGENDTIFIDRDGVFHQANQTS